MEHTITATTTPLPLASLYESPTNPRKTFKPDALQALHHVPGKGRRKKTVPCTATAAGEGEPEETVQ